MKKYTTLKYCTVTYIHRMHLGSSAGIHELLKELPPPVSFFPHVALNQLRSHFTSGKHSYYRHEKALANLEFA